MATRLSGKSIPWGFWKQLASALHKSERDIRSVKFPRPSSTETESPSVNAAIKLCMDIAASKCSGIDGVYGFEGQDTPPITTPDDLVGQVIDHFEVCKEALGVESCDTMLRRLLSASPSNLRKIETYEKIYAPMVTKIIWHSRSPCSPWEPYLRISTSWA